MKSRTSKNKTGSRGVSLPDSLNKAVKVRLATSGARYANFSHYVRCLIEEDLAQNPKEVKPHAQ